MNKIIFVSFDSEKQALAGARAITELWTVTMYAGAIITKDAHGNIIVHQSLVKRPTATLGGLLLDSLMGLLGPAAIALDKGSGALLGAAIDAAKAGITTEFLDKIDRDLARGKTGLIADVDEIFESPIDMRMEPLGGTVFRQTRTQLADAFFEKEIEAQRMELANLENEKVAKATAIEEHESAQQDAHLQAKIDATKRTIEEKQSRLAERIRSVWKEGEEKIGLLQSQMADADVYAKIHLDHRVEDIRFEYESRARKLSQALERLKATRAA